MLRPVSVNPPINMCVRQQVSPSDSEGLSRSARFMTMFVLCSYVVLSQKARSVYSASSPGSRPTSQAVQAYASSFSTEGTLPSYRIVLGWEISKEQSGPRPASACSRVKVGGLGHCHAHPHAAHFPSRPPTHPVTLSLLQLVQHHHKRARNQSGEA